MSPTRSFGHWRDDSMSRWAKPPSAHPPPFVEGDSVSAKSSNDHSSETVCVVTPAAARLFPFFKRGVPPKAARGSLTQPQQFNLCKARFRETWTRRAISASSSFRR